MKSKLTGLVAATHTPFDAHGELNLTAIEKQAEHLSRDGVQTVFIGGSTGESHSLTAAERCALAGRWSEVVRGTDLALVVHVGANCLADARLLAANAQAVGAKAISALAPSYFKPKTLDTLIDCCVHIAGAAPEVPFYFYDIPVMTAVSFSMPEFLAVTGKRVPSLAGIKFSNPDLMAFQKCLQREQGRFDILWGIDEYLLAALSLGATGAVGSSYNFAAPIYHRLLTAFAGGDLATARLEQYRSVQVIDLLAEFGYMGAAKAVMGMLGVDVGRPRLPNSCLTAEQETKLRERLEELDFFAWRK